MPQPDPAASYRARSSAVGTLRGQPITVVAKPGLPGGAAVGEAAALCARLLAPAPDERQLLLGCGNGALAVAMHRLSPAGRLVLHDPHLIALRMAAATLEANAVGGALLDERISRLPDEAASYDRVVLLAPQSRSLGRRWLLEAHELLRPGGTLTLAGANNGGIQPLIADAQALFGNGHLLGYGGGCRVAEAIRTDPPPAPPWAAAPGIAPGSWATLVAPLPDGPVELVSLPGIFSAERLDAGTAFLLQRLPLAAGLRILDVGCGYGPIGIHAARRGAAHVTMLDVNLLAVAAARDNVRRLGLGSTAQVDASDALEAAQGRYDLVVSNPPFHAGRQVDTVMAAAFIAEARSLLVPGGQLALVANRFLPYERELGQHFDRVEQVAATGAYKLLIAVATAGSIR